MDLRVLIGRDRDLAQSKPSDPGETNVEQGICLLRACSDRDQNRVSVSVSRLCVRCEIVSLRAIYAQSCI